MRDLKRSSPVRGSLVGFGGSWLDVKLGYRLLKKYPVLTAIGVLSISVTVGVAAGLTAFSHNFTDPVLPVPEDDRLIGIQLWDIASNRPEMNGLYDFGVWRDELESVEELGAFERYQPNLITRAGRSEPVLGSRITASALATARVAPLLGRLLVPEDELGGAENVVVLGHDIWQRVFAADSSVLGETIRLGQSTHTVVGVMPPGFRFPYNDDVWVPLREDPLTTEPGDGPVVMVVGRLAEGLTLQMAQAELSGLGLRMAQDRPQTHEFLRPRLAGYGSTAWAGPPLPFSLARALLAILLVVVCANVGALVYARNATRMPEVTVRRALGASRVRVLLQLLIEGAILASLGAVLGVFLARLGLNALGDVAADAATGGTLALPYWWTWDLTGGAMTYVVSLTVLGTAVVGLGPAVKLTRRPSGKLLRISERGAVAPSFGMVAKVAISLQVGLSVGLLAAAASQLPPLLRASTAEVSGLVADRYLTAELQPEETPASSEEVVRATTATWQTARELKTRLSEEPEVGRVTLASAFPGMTYPQRMVEVEGGMVTGPTPVRVGRIDNDFLGAMGTPFLTGRNFNSGDATAGNAPSVAIVNEPFAQRFLGDQNPIGRRVRFATPGSEPSPWMEVVGLVADPGMNLTDPATSEGLFVPLTYDSYPIGIALSVVTDPSAFEPRLRSVAAEVDPTLRLLRVRSLEAVMEASRTAERWAYVGIVLATLSALGLALTSVYAVTSFLVSQRTREIGIRVALGAGPKQITANILLRALLPAGVGLGLGAVLAVAVGASLGAGSVWVAVEVCVATIAAVLLACLGPARRALTIHPGRAIQAGP